MTSTDKARAHARIAYWCTCGKVVHGNGGKWSHAQKHRRRESLNPPGWMGEKIKTDHYVTRADFERLMATR